MTAHPFDSAQGKPFELRIILLPKGAPRRYGEDEYGLGLYQQPVRSLRLRSGQAPSRVTKDQEPQLVVRIWGAAFRSTVDRVLAALKDNGYRASELSKTRKAPFLLSEESGVRLGLLCMASKPLRKLSRIEAISNAIWAMSPEEAYYWFSKCTDPLTGRRAQRALRILLADR
jgi:hypothetical protein